MEEAEVEALAAVLVGASKLVVAMEAIEVV